MKIQTLRNLIQEEIVKVLNETIQKAPLREKVESFKTIEDYAQHLKDTGVLSGTYRIVNGKIQVSGNVDLTLDDLLNGKIPFAFGKVSGYFFCGDIELTSLENCPEAVNGHFICSYNQLTSLAGAPKSIGRDFNCEYNSLTSLAGAPKSIGEDFNCSDNSLTSLAGAPKTVGGSFSCYKNLKKFTENDVTSICKVKGTISV